MTRRWGLPLVVFAVVWLAMQFSAPLYSQPIARIEAVKTTQTASRQDNFGNPDQIITQKLQAKLLNTRARGRQVALVNTYARSQVEAPRMYVGTQVFLTRDHNGQYGISNVKRDAVLCGLAAATVCLMGLVIKRRLALTLLAIGVNTGLFMLALHIEIASHQALAFGLFVVLAVAFTAVTTILVIGFKPLAAVVASATILATGLGVGLGYAIFALTDYRGLHLETVKYVTQAPQLLFFVQVIIGSLGAVLDEAADIAAGVSQLPATGRARFTVGIAIGRDVMGPLIAVLFMLFMAETFAEAVLWLRNGNAINATVSWVMGLGFAQALISAFGIVLAIPVTSGLASVSGWWQSRKRRRAR